MKKLFYIIFSILILLNSCEKVIPFDLKTKEPKIVINSLFESDKTWNVHLSSSLSSIDTSNLSNIENASITIYDEKNQVIETLHYDSLGFYNGTTSPEAGQQYIIEVSAINHKTATAEDRIPTETTISEIDTSSFIENNNERLSIQLSFNQALSNENYYKIGVRIGRDKYVDNLNQNGINEVDTNYKEKWLTLKPESNFLMETISSKELIFNDNSFNSSEATVTFSIKNLIKKSSLDDNYNLEFMTVYLYEISSNQYNFYNSMKIYEDNSSNIFAQPVQVFSNVTNGHGIFVGSTANKIQLY